MRISILVPGFGYPSPAIGAFEVFSSAGVLWNTLLGEGVDAAFEVETASEDGNKARFRGGVEINPDRAVSQIRHTDLIFVPSIGLELENVFKHNRKMIRLLQRQAEKGTLIAAVCTGVAMLAEAGILEGRSATTHWALSDTYCKRYPNVDWKPELFITEQDNIICGGGVYASLDVCLYLVERFAGYEVAKQTGQALLIDAPRTWQSSFATHLVKQQHQDKKIQDAQTYLHEYFNKQFTMDELSQRLGMSIRNFSRRFKRATGQAPLTYLHKIRVNCAKQLLETDFKSVQEVCFEVGYDDVPFFRNIFKRYTGLSPKDYKSRFASHKVRAPQNMQ